MSYLELAKKAEEKLNPSRGVPQPEPGEVERIVQAWSEILGMKLNPDAVRKHLATIRRWESRLQHKQDTNLL